MAGQPLTREKRYAAEAEKLAERRPEPKRRTEPATLNPETEAEVLELGTHGFDMAEIAAHLDVSEETLQGWRDAHPAFDDVATRARAKAKAWWLSRAREAIRDNNSRFAAGAWAAVMRARYPDFAPSETVVRVDLTTKLVMVDLRAGLLGEQRVEPDGPLLINDSATTIQLSQGTTGSETTSGAATIDPGGDVAEGRPGHPGGAKTAREDSTHPSIPIRRPPTPGG